MKMEIPKTFEFAQTEKFKNLMAKLYGWGASVVILGALFKILHWPGADLMLILGLGTESIIFFFSAFEPVKEEYDWSLVYPELAAMDKGGPSKVAFEQATKDYAQQLAKASSNLEAMNKLYENYLQESAAQLRASTKLMEDLSSTAENSQKIKDALGSLADNVEQLNSVYGKMFSAIKG